MRFTIARKLAAGLTALACLGIMTMLVVYSGLLSVERAMHHLSESREPASTAGHEMEINVNEIGLSVLKYLEGGDPSSREHVATDVAEFEHFHARYVELAETETEKSLAATVGERFREFKTLGQVLLSRRDVRIPAIVITAIAPS